MAQPRTVDTGTEQLHCLIRDGVAVITLNRPEARNAFTPAMSSALRGVIAASAGDPGVRAVMVTGAGTAFCAGGDVKSMGDRRPTTGESREQRLRVMLQRHHGTAGALRALRKPTVAALPGAAAGAGLALALACDIRIAAVSAVLTTGYTRIGLSGDYGIAWMLTQTVGPGRARELMLTGERIAAARAAEIGLVNRVVDDAVLQDEAFALARTLAEGPTVAIGYIKDNLDEAMSIGHAEAIDREAERLLRTQSTEDHRDAVRAFVEKRPARFQGR